MKSYLCPRGGESYPVRPDDGRCPTHLVLVIEVDALAVSAPAPAVSALAPAARPSAPKAKVKAPKESSTKTAKKAPKGR